MANFTPGPWDVNSPSDSDCVWGGKIGTDLICQCFGENSTEDAILIAAAPDLRAACEELFEFICAHLPAQQPNGDENEMIERAREAIAKAKGREVINA